MLKIKYIVCVLFLLGACQSLPEQFEAKDLALTVYQNEIGELILPVPKNAGEKRRIAWEKWLHHHRDIWNTQPNQIVTGKTRWCAQWQQNGEQRMCNRNNQTLVWFGYGQSSDKNAIEAANKIWIGR